MGGGKGKTEIQVAEYYLSVDFGICHGPLDSLNSIWIKEQLAWEGRVETNGALFINNKELFGGYKKEGGVYGIADVYLGTPTQKMSASTASRYGLTSDTMPGYRGIAHVMFRGPEAGEVPPAPSGTSLASSGFFGLILGALSNRDQPENQAGFLWVMNNPYLPATWLGVTRIPRGWLDDIAAIPRGAGNDFIQHYNANWKYKVEAAGSGADYSSPGYDDSAWSVGQGGFGNNAAGYGTPESNTYVSPGTGKAIWLRTVIPAGTEGEEYIITLWHDDGPQLWIDGEAVDLSGSSETYFKTVLKIPTSASPRVLAYKVMDAVPAGNPTYIYAAMDIIPAGPDANPAHMIREGLTNEEWGLGVPVGDIGASFEVAANTLFNEGFGLTMTWTQQSSIEKVVQEICDHIQGMVYLDPETGLWEIKLIRGDYDIETDDLIVLDPTNCVATNRQRKAMSETTNEIVVTYTNPENDEDVSITFQDIANIGMQGGIRSETRSYYGIRGSILAQKVGARDLRSASYPLFSCDLTVNTTVGKLKPGQVVILNWPDDDLYGMPLRVYKVDYGKPGSSTMSLTVTEDIFGLGLVSYDPVDASADDSGTTAPQPIEYLSVVTAPLPLLLRSGFALSDVSDDDYPSAIMAVFGNSLTSPVDTMRLTAQVTKANAEVVEEVVAEVQETPLQLSTIAFAREATSIVDGAAIREMLGVYVEPETGDFIQLGMTDLASEIVMLYSYDDGADEYTVARGIFDTIPQEWPIDTPVWYLGTSVSQLDTSENAVGTGDYYKVQTTNSGGVLNLASATTHVFTPTARAYAPHRPANVIVDGQAFPTAVIDCVGVDPIPSSWVERDRLAEDVVAPRWTDATVTPEPGQETNIVFLDPATGVEFNRITGLTGLTHDIPASAFLGYPMADLKFVAVRDGLESVQGHTVRVAVSSGYGYSYGFNYGGI